MKAMILAAGLGTRLRPLTDDRPKALVEINSRSLLEITLRRLRAFGVHEVIVNVHHFADMVADYLQRNDDFGMQIEISREDELLDTGGGLKKAAWFFLADSAQPNQPLLLHNVDVISDIDLGRMLQFHHANQALATIAVQNRETSRYLLFDEHGQLSGRRTDDKAPELIGSPHSTDAWAFCGVHVISPGLFSMLTEDGAFSIINAYLRLAAQGEKIMAFRADGYYWRDLGKPSSLAQATQDAEQGIIQL